MRSTVARRLPIRSLRRPCDRRRPLAILAVLLVVVVLMFNRMIRLRNHTRSAWSDVDVALKRRAELIPNLVETVKGYAAHEQQTIEQVTKARVDSEAAHNVAAQEQASGELNTALRRLMAVAENYPELKASDNFLELQKSSERRPRTGSRSRVRSTTTPCRPTRTRASSSPPT